MSSTNPVSCRRVVLTDHPWPDLEIETAIFHAAGIELVAGPIQAPDEASVEKAIIEADPDAVLTCWAAVSAAAISTPTRLRVVTRLGIGVDNIAIAAATERGAWVTNVPDYCTGEVSDHAVALMLANIRGVVAFNSAAKRGEWNPALARLERMVELTVGIIGYGRIGRETARKIAAFGCRVMAYSPSLKASDGPAEAATLDRIREECDVIILHAPLSASTHHLVDHAFLNACLRRPLLINVSRGGLVDNDALLAALSAGLLRGAALDVIEGEPAPPKAILEHPGIIVTPHISFSSSASLIELRTRACEEVVRVLGGARPFHPCNEPSAPGELLEGGVASDIRIVTGANGPEVVKRALPKLRVRADWFSDPARSVREVAALRTAAELIGQDAVPTVLWSDPAAHTFGMNLVDPSFRNWKEQILAGNVSDVVSARAGAMLGQLHRRSMDRADIADAFADTANFEELRIEPFFTRTAAASADLGPFVLQVAADMARRRTALVHGDYSPKNILTDGKDIVILDWEVAHWGDPRFDIAFCLSHLILKAYRGSADRRAILASADSFGRAYKAENDSAWDADLRPVVGALLMARIVGPSPVDYLADVDVDSARLAAGTLLGRADSPPQDFIQELEFAQ